jgi:hypothetical protein
VLRVLADGSCLSVLISPQIDRRRGERRALAAAAQAGQHLDDAKARYVRVIDYQAGDQGEQIILITTITDPALASAKDLAAAYHQRWEHETANGQLKTALRGPGQILRSKSPAMIRQEIYGYLLAHYAITALICAAATQAGIDPDRVKFTRTLRIIRRHTTAAFPP